MSSKEMQCRIAMDHFNIAFQEYIQKGMFACLGQLANMFSLYFIFEKLEHSPYSSRDSKSYQQLALIVEISERIDLLLGLQKIPQKFPLFQRRTKI
jgi:hypothetical protein